MVVLFLIFWGSSFSGCTSFASYQQCIKGPLFSTSSPTIVTACLPDDSTLRLLPCFAHCLLCCSQADNPMWGAFPHAHLFLACAFPTSFGPLAMSCERSHASVPTGSQLSSIFTAFITTWCVQCFLLIACFTLDFFSHGWVTRTSNSFLCGRF